MDAKLTSVLLLMLLLAAGNATSAAERVYQWTDKEGVVHYSSQPPPMGTEATEKVLEPMPLIGTQELQPRPANSATGELAPREKAMADREEIARQRINASSYEEALAVECIQAESVIAKLTDSGDIQIADASGNARIMNEKERQERITLANEFIRDNCQ